MSNIKRGLQCDIVDIDELLGGIEVLKRVCLLFMLCILFFLPFSSLRV